MKLIAVPEQVIKELLESIDEAISMLSHSGCETWAERHLRSAKHKLEEQAREIDESRFR